MLHSTLTPSMDSITCTDLLSQARPGLTLSGRCIFNSDAEHWTCQIYQPATLQTPTYNVNMPNLPHGWRMRNSTGEVRGPSPEEDGFLSGDDIGSQSGSDAGSRLDIRPDSEGWEDLEDDSESLSIKCLLCDTKFSSAESMVEHCKQAHDFDLLQIQRQYSKYRCG